MLNENHENSKHQKPNLKQMVLEIWDFIVL